MFNNSRELWMLGLLYVEDNSYDQLILDPFNFFGDLIKHKLFLHLLNFILLFKNN